MYLFLKCYNRKNSNTNPEYAAIDFSQFTGDFPKPISADIYNIAHTEKLELLHEDIFFIVTKHIPFKKIKNINITIRKNYEDKYVEFKTEPNIMLPIIEEEDLCLLGDEFDIRI